MIVVTVAVVEGDYDSHAFPLPCLLKRVNGLYQEHLLVQRIRNAARVPGLIALRLDIAYCRQIVRFCGSQKIGQVILMVGLAGMPYLRDI